MTTVAEIKSETGKKFLIEVDSESPKPGKKPAGILSDASLAIGRNIEEVLDDIEAVSSLLVQRLEPLFEKSNEMSVTFGVSFGVEGGVILAKGSAESNLSISIKWDKSDR